MSSKRNVNWISCTLTVSRLDCQHLCKSTLEGAGWLSFASPGSHSNHMILVIIQRNKRDPPQSNTSSCNGIKGAKENMDIGFERSLTALDLRQLSPVVWCLSVCEDWKKHKKWRKHIDSKCWDRLVTGQTCFPFSGEIHCAYSYTQESDCSLSYTESHLQAIF